MGRKKINRRGKNEGSIRLRKDGYYEARVTLGVDANGKQIQKSIYGKQRTDVAQKMNSLMMNVHHGTYVNETSISLNVWLSKWLEDYAKLKVKETTFELYYNHSKNHIIPALGFYKLNKLKTSNIQTFINELSKKELAAGTIKYIINILRGAIKQAVKEKLITTDITKNCVLPKDIQKEMNVLEPKCINDFLELAKKNKYYIIFLLELHTGLRRGELLGLRWRDINFKEGSIEINQQVVKLNYKSVITDLKTTYANRKLYLPQNIISELEKHNKNQKVQMIKHRKTWNDKDLVFTNPWGRVLNPQTLCVHFKSIVKPLGLGYIRFHDLRHTYALNCLNQGVDIKTLQEQLGHHNASFTISRYGHSTDEMKKSAANKIGDFLNQYIK